MTTLFSTQRNNHGVIFYRNKAAYMKSNTILPQCFVWILLRLLFYFSLATGAVLHFCVLVKGHAYLVLFFTDLCWLEPRTLDYTFPLKWIFLSENVSQLPQISKLYSVNVRVWIGQRQKHPSQCSGSSQLRHSRSQQHDKLKSTADDHSLGPMLSAAAVTRERPSCDATTIAGLRAFKARGEASNMHILTYSRKCVVATKPFKCVVATNQWLSEARGS